MKPAHYQSFSENDVLQGSSHRSEPRPIQGIRSDYVEIQASNASSFEIGQHNSNTKCDESKELSHFDLTKLSSSRDAKTVVVVPSIDLDGKELRRMCKQIEFYEERQLYNLLLLKDPSFRVIYLTSHQISSDILRYYLTLDDEDARNLANRLSRLYILHPKNISCNHFSKSLSNNLVQDEKLMQTIKHILSQVSNGESPSAGLSVFCGSLAADQLAHNLNLRLLEAKSDDLYFGSKQGSREIFRKCNVPHASGTPDLDAGDDDLLTIHNAASSHWADNHPFIRTPRGLAIGIARQIVIRNVKPERWIIKLNQGFSGRGNAIIDLCSIQENINYSGLSFQNKGDYNLETINSIADEIELALPRMVFECPGMTWLGNNEHAGFKDQIKSLGVVAEAVLVGNDLSSPSVQAVIEPQDKASHTVKLLSTHEQILIGQTYHGCINPALENYREKIIKYTGQIGRELSSHGIVGHFAVDFLVRSNRAMTKKKTWDVHAIEINLRQGGTTHPYSTMALLCGGSSDRDGIFHTLDGELRCYMATDSFKDDRLVSMSSAEIIVIIQDKTDEHAKKIAWNINTKTGVVFHLLSFVSFGKIGFTAIGSCKEEANFLFDQALLFLKKVAEKWSTRNDQRF